MKEVAAFSCFLFVKCRFIPSDADRCCLWQALEASLCEIM